MLNKRNELRTEYTEAEISLMRLLAQNPVIYIGSPIHHDIEELVQITGRKIEYFDYKRISLVSDEVLELSKNGRVKRTGKVEAKAPEPVIEFKKKRSNKGDFSTDIKRNPTVGPAMFDLNEFSAENDVIEESKK